MTPDEALEVLRGTATGRLAWEQQQRERHAVIEPYEVTWDDPAEVFAHPLAPWALDWPTFWADDDAPSEWLCEPILVRGRAHAIYAGAKTGKSYVVLAMAAALATGRPFLEQPAQTPLEVVYCDFEMTAADVRERLLEFGYGPDVDLSHLHYVVAPSIGGLDTEEGGAALLESVDAWAAELVIVDTTGRAMNGSENDADAMNDYYRHTGSKLKRAGVTAVRIDHAGKDATKGQRGSSAKNDDVDLIALLTRTDDGLTWRHTHRRLSWVREQVAVHVTEADDGTVRFSTDGYAWPAGTADCAADLDELGVPIDATTRAAAELLKAADRSRRRATIVAAIRLRRERLELALEGDEQGIAERGTTQSSDVSENEAAPSAEPFELTCPSVNENGRNRSAEPSAPSTGANVGTAAPVPMGTGAGAHAEAPELELAQGDELEHEASAHDADLTPERYL